MRRALLLASLTFALACDDAIETSTLTPELEAPGALDLGRVFVGARRVSAVEVRSAGAANLALLDVDVEGDPAWSLLSAPPDALSPGALWRAELVYAPLVAGPSEAALRIEVEGGARLVQLSAQAAPPLDCAPSSACVTRAFDPDQGACVETQREGSCDDGNACTTNDTCVDGRCLGEARACAAPDACSVGVCDAAQGCVALPDPSACDDGNPCTADLCDADAGCSHPALADGTLCSAQVSCAAASVCIAGGCVAVVPPDGTPCADGDSCTADDRCQAGVCGGDPVQRPASVTHALPGFGSTDDIVLPVEGGELFFDPYAGVDGTRVVELIDGEVRQALTLPEQLIPAARLTPTEILLISQTPLPGELLRRLRREPGSGWTLLPGATDLGGSFSEVRAVLDSGDGVVIVTNRVDARVSFHVLGGERITTWHAPAHLAAFDKQTGRAVLNNHEVWDLGDPLQPTLVGAVPPGSWKRGPPGRAIRRDLSAPDRIESYDLDTLTLTGALEAPATLSVDVEDVGLLIVTPETLYFTSPDLEVLSTEPNPGVFWSPTWGQERLYGETGSGLAVFERDAEGLREIEPVGLGGFGVLRELDGGVFGLRRDRAWRVSMEEAELRATGGRRFPHASLLRVGPLGPGYAWPQPHGAVVDIAHPGAPVVLGDVPDDWGAVVTADGRRLHQTAPQTAGVTVHAGALAGVATADIELEPLVTVAEGDALTSWRASAAGDRLALSGLFVGDWLVDLSAAEATPLDLGLSDPLVLRVEVFDEDRAVVQASDRTLVLDLLDDGYAIRLELEQGGWALGLTPRWLLLARQGALEFVDLIDEPGRVIASVPLDEWPSSAALWRPASDDEHVLVTSGRSLFAVRTPCP